MPKTHHWIISKKQISEFEEGNIVDKNKSLRACGCGVKIDLDHIVYPVLDEIHQNHQHTFQKEAVNLRRDSFAYPGYLKSLKRVVSVNLDEYRNQMEKILSESSFHAILELFSSRFNLYREFDKLLDYFKDQQNRKYGILDNIFKKTLINQNQLQFAKGHSIQGEVDFLINDLVAFEDCSNVITLANNDTIITGDSILEPHSPISVFISLNNALNDLFIHGGFKNIKIYPVYDGSSLQVEKFRKAFQLYADYFKKNNVSIEIVDQGPLNIHSHLIGASVFSETQNQPPTFKSVRPGQKIMLTHKLGDLAILSINRTHFKKGTKNEYYAQAREDVLQKLMRSHYDMSSIISRYLPNIGEAHDDDIHVSFVSDVSGPGLSVLEEAANNSGVSMRIEHLEFITDDILNYPRKNYTTSTNGPWLIIGKEDVLKRIEEDFKSIGLQEIHYIGETILQNSNEGTIYIKKELTEKYSQANYTYNLFHPEIQVDTTSGIKKIQCPLFSKFETY